MPATRISPDGPVTVTVPWSVLGTLGTTYSPWREFSVRRHFEVVGDGLPGDDAVFADGTLLFCADEDVAPVLAGLERALGATVTVLREVGADDVLVLSSRPLHVVVQSHQPDDPRGTVSFTFDLTGVEAPVGWTEARRIESVDQLRRDFHLVGEDPPDDDLAGRLIGGSAVYTPSVAAALWLCAVEQQAGATTLLLWHPCEYAHPVLATSRSLAEVTGEADLVGDTGEDVVIVAVLPPRYHADLVAASFESVDPVDYGTYLGRLQAVVDAVLADGRAVGLVMVERPDYLNWCRAQRRAPDSSQSLARYARAAAEASGCHDWDGMVADLLFSLGLIHVAETEPGFSETFLALVDQGRDPLVPMDGALDGGRAGKVTAHVRLPIGDLVTWPGAPTLVRPEPSGDGSSAFSVALSDPSVTRGVGAGRQVFNAAVLAAVALGGDVTVTLHDVDRSGADEVRVVVAGGEVVG